MIGTALGKTSVKVMQCEVKALEELFESKYGIAPTAEVLFQLSTELYIGVRPSVKVFSNRTLVTWHAGSNLTDLSSNKFSSSSLKGALIRALLHYDKE